MMSGNLLIRNMPDPSAIRSARLPEVYQTAKLAIRQCAEIDECREWANKAEALASYARQMDDNELRMMADRIQARAIARAGAILKEIEKAQGMRTDRLQDGTVPKLTRTQAATDAGLSERQRKTALRVANIPQAEFEEAIESENPPTVTALAERGKQSRPKPIVDLGTITPAQYSAATDLIGLVRRFKDESAAIEMDLSISGLKKHEIGDVIANAKKCLQWLQVFIATIEERKCTQAVI